MMKTMYWPLVETGKRGRHYTCSKTRSVYRWRKAKPGTRGDCDGTSISKKNFADRVDHPRNMVVGAVNADRLKKTRKKR